MSKIIWSISDEGEDEEFRFYVQEHRDSNDASAGRFSTISEALAFMRAWAPTLCQHCDREIVQSSGYWVDPKATGDDSMWRETCDAHDTFIADHEPFS